MGKVKFYDKTIEVEMVAFEESPVYKDGVYAYTLITIKAVAKPE